MVATTPIIPDWLIGLVQRYGGQYANDTTFQRIVASGAFAESGGFNVNAEQVPGVMAGGKGLFQFDFSGGQGTGLIRSGIISSYTQVLGMPGAALQAQHIIPDYAAAYGQGLTRGLTGADLGTFTIGQAERPQGWYLGAVSWHSQVGSYENYKRALAIFLTGDPQTGQTGIPVPLPGVTTPQLPQIGTQQPAQPTTGATTPASPPAPGMVQAGQIGGVQLGVPSGLLLGLIAFALLLVGAILLYEQQSRINVTLSE